MGIEIKAAGAVGPRDVQGLQFLERELPDAFAQGIVLHSGADVVPFSERIRAVPMSALWRTEPGSE